MQWSFKEMLNNPPESEMSEVFIIIRLAIIQTQQELWPNEVVILAEEKLHFV